MSRFFLALLASFGLNLSLFNAAHSHEFWMMATLAKTAQQSIAQLSLHVGENFEGQLVGWTAASIPSLQVIHAQGKQDLRSRLNDTAVAGLNLPLNKSGTHLFALDSSASLITLGAEKFHAYLREEGLEDIIAQREAAGTSNTPGRERYRRHVKALLHAGGKSDASYAQRTGQRLEILPLRDPFRTASKTRLPFAVLFEGKPLANVLVKAWLKQDNQLLILRARSDEKGEVNFNLPFAGTWMISVVYMLPANDADADWDSLWGNLSFTLAEKNLGKK